MIVTRITDLIGKTPLFAIPADLHGLKNINLYAKLELMSPFGSVKDKSAWMVLKDEIEQVRDRCEIILDSSSGNMAKAIQLIASTYGVPVKIVTNRIKVKEVKQILQLLGTEIDELPGLSSCPDPTDPNDPLAFIERMMSASPGKYHHTSQYTNEKTLEAHYESTGREIIEDLGRVDFFIGGLGTTGSTRGAGTFLKERNPELRTIGVIAPKGQLLPGIRNADEMFEVGLFRRDFYDAIVEVDQNESIDAMLLLIRKLGILSGPTGGGSFAAALKYLREIDPSLKEPQNAVFIVCDRVEWYLSYLQKNRPELFGLSARRDSLNAVTPEEMDGAPEMDVDEAEEWLKTIANPLVVDMRGALAFKSARIANSVNLPADTLEELTDWGVPFSSSQNILFVCPVGDQSKKCAAYFSAKGINCKSLRGGFVSWRDNNKPVERQKVQALVGVR